MKGILTLQHKLGPIFHIFFICMLAACSAPTAFSTPAPQISPAPTASNTPQPTNSPEPTQTPIPVITNIPVQPVMGLPQGTNGYPWWNDAVFYEIFVRSFADSNGDGIGDFNGLASRLDYLNDGDPSTNTDLGINGIWLMPIHPSPSYHGYDVVDYYDVNPEYGTLDDFKNLVKEAHKRGIKITIDWVLNHTSTQNQWFIESQNPQSPFRNWYLWSTSNPGSERWHVAKNGDYYYGIFDQAMPDLNYDNPEVKAEMKKVVKFWLEDIGVDGFRLDAARHIFEEGANIENLPQTHAWYKELRPFYKEINPNAMTVGEIWTKSEIVSTYLQGDELDLAFDFDLAKNIVFSAGTNTPKYAFDALNKDNSLFKPGQFATFLTNHDQERAMSTLGDNLESAKNAAFILLTSPGVPYIYYGEEIGMLGKKPDENIRLPMQWSNEEGGGFSTSTPWRAMSEDYITKNVALQSSDPNSLLSFYRTLIHLRQNHSALRVGDYTIIRANNRSIYAGLRSNSEETVLVLANFSSKPIKDYTLRLESSKLSGEYNLIALVGGGEFVSPILNEKGGFETYTPINEIPPFGKIILQLQKK